MATGQPRTSISLYMTSVHPTPDMHRKSVSTAQPIESNLSRSSALKNSSTDGMPHVDTQLTLATKGVISSPVAFAARIAAVAFGGYSPAAHSSDAISSHCRPIVPGSPQLS